MKIQSKTYLHKDPLMRYKIYHIIIIKTSQHKFVIVVDLLSKSNRFQYVNLFNNSQLLGYQHFYTFEQ